MRDLTIKRHKSFVGCLAKFKVYIEDPASRELTIAGVPCRKLGELKNGQEQTFQIGTEETRLFVISDKFSKDYSKQIITHLRNRWGALTHHNGLRQ